MSLDNAIKLHTIEVPGWAWWWCAIKLCTIEVPGRAWMSRSSCILLKYPDKPGGGVRSSYVLLKYPDKPGCHDWAAYYWSTWMSPVVLHNWVMYCWSTQTSLVVVCDWVMYYWSTINEWAGISENVLGIWAVVGSISSVGQPQVKTYPWLLQSWHHNSSNLAADGTAEAFFGWLSKMCPFSPQTSQTSLSLAISWMTGIFWLLVLKCEGSQDLAGTDSLLALAAWWDTFSGYQHSISLVSCCTMCLLKYNQNSRTEWSHLLCTWDQWFVLENHLNHLHIYSCALVSGCPSNSQDRQSAGPEVRTFQPGTPGTLEM